MTWEKNPTPSRNLGSLGLGALIFTGLSPAGGLALPPDPQRPFVAQTCEAAQARLAEAEAGSPLISAAENDTVLAGARAQVDRLCGELRQPEPLGDETMQDAKGE